MGVKKCRAGRRSDTQWKRTPLGEYEGKGEIKTIRGKRGTDWRRASFA